MSEICGAFFFCFLFLFFCFCFVLFFGGGGVLSEFYSTWSILGQYSTSSTAGRGSTEYM